MNFSKIRESIVLWIDKNVKNPTEDKKPGSVEDNELCDLFLPTNSYF